MCTSTDRTEKRNRSILYYNYSFNSSLLKINSSRRFRKDITEHDHNPSQYIRLFQKTPCGNTCPSQAHMENSQDKDHILG